MSISSGSMFIGVGGKGDTGRIGELSPSGVGNPLAGPLPFDGVPGSMSSEDRGARSPLEKKAE